MVIFVEHVNSARELSASCELIEALDVNIETVQSANLALAIFGILVNLPVLSEDASVRRFDV